MNCAAFARWLDAGAAAVGAADAHSHAAGCAGCRAHERAALEIDSLLSWVPASEPAGFTAGVMARIDSEARRSGSVSWLEPLVPWWWRALAQPACVLAGLLAALLVGLAARGPATLAGARAALHGILEAEPVRVLAATCAANATLADPTRRVALMLTLFPIAMLAAIAVYGVAQRWARRSAAPFAASVRMGPRAIG